MKQQKLNIYLNNQMKEKWKKNICHYFNWAKNSKPLSFEEFAKMKKNKTGSKKYEYHWKIVKYCDQHGLDYFQSFSKIINDSTINNIAAERFAKSPNKQNFYEILILKKINEHLSLLNLPNIKKIDSSNKKKIYLMNSGALTTNKSQAKSKAIDFLYTSKNKNIYISHKFAKEAGGHQDNQINDATELYLNLAKKNNDEKNIFISVLDGSYMEEKIKELKNKYNYKNKCFIMNSEELISFIIKYEK